MADHRAGELHLHADRRAQDDDIAQPTPDGLEKQQCAEADRQDPQKIHIRLRQYEVERYLQQDGRGQRQNANRRRNDEDAACRLAEAVRRFDNVPEGQAVLRRDLVHGQTRFKLQHDTGEILLEIGPVERTRTDGRVLDMEPPAADTLQNNIMLALPM